jgi:hypothetical protein
MAKASVLLTWTHSDRNKYRLVSQDKYQYIVDRLGEDSVGDPVWVKITNFKYSSNTDLISLLTSAVFYLLNPNAIIANDAELEGDPGSAEKILQSTEESEKFKRLLAELTGRQNPTCVCGHSRVMHDVQGYRCSLCECIHYHV